jgi:hypothetical protein
MPADIVSFEDAAEAFERDKKVIALLISGAARRRIAEQLGITVGEVDAAHVRMVGGLPPDFKARTMQLMLERADALLSGHWLKAKGGDVKSADIVLKVERHRASLLGLYPLPVRDDAMDDLKEKETSTEYYERVLDELQGKGRQTIDGVVSTPDAEPDEP